MKKLRLLGAVCTCVFVLNVMTTSEVVAKPPGGAAEQFLNLILDIRENTGFKAIEFDLRSNPLDDSGESFVILPFVDGHAYSGHLEAVFTPGTGNRIILACGSENAVNTAIFVIKQEDNQLVFGRDFSCSHLSISIVDVGDGNEANSAAAKGIVTYSQTDEVEQIEAGQNP